MDVITMVLHSYSIVLHNDNDNNNNNNNNNNNIAVTQDFKILDLAIIYVCHVVLDLMAKVIFGFCIIRYFRKSDLL